MIWIIFKNVSMFKVPYIFINFPYHESLHRVMEAILPSYYQNWNYKYIIDRGPAGTEGNLYLLKKIDTFQNFPDEQSLNNVMDEVYNLYYKNWNYKYIIDRGPAGTIGNLKVLNKHFKKEIKIIFLVRPILEVLASWVTWASRTPDAAIRRISKNPTDMCHMLMNKEGQIAKELLCMQNLLKPENKHMVHFVDYKEIINKPQSTIKGI